jgi:transformer-2 protein
MIIINNFFQTKESRGYCFIYFDDISDAKPAISAVDGMEIDGRRIRVDYSLTTRSHSPTPGYYLGRPLR